MSKDVMELWGHEFSIVKNGLSENEIASFVSKLIKERDALAKRQEHLSSLVQLAERTVVQADNIAKQIEEDATNRAKTEADTIIARAEEQAQQIIEEKTKEAMAVGRKEAETIKANAQKQAELLLEEKVKGVQTELKNTAQRLYSELLTRLENLRKQVTKSEMDFEQTLSKPEEETSTTDKEEKDNDKHDKLLELIQKIGRKTIDESEWEIEVLPPMDKIKIVGFVTHLNSIPEVEKTEIIQRTDKSVITVSLNEPVRLTDILETLPEVTQVKEVAEKNTSSNGKAKKVQIVLTGEPTPEEVT
jgi:F0F1-type ATP synthase membrane subunit b/b'